jgi:hypothetical protein
MRRNAAETPRNDKLLQPCSQRVVEANNPIGSHHQGRCEHGVELSDVDLEDARHARVIRV